MKINKQRAVSVTLALLLAGCGSGTDTGTSAGGGGNTSTNNTPSSAGRLVLLDPTRSNAVTPISNLQYWNAGNVSDANGSFALPSGTTLQLYVSNQAPLAVPATTSVTQQNMANALCSQNADPTACAYNAAKNLEHFFLSLDSDHNSANGIQLSPIAANLSLAWTASPDQFASALAQQLSAYGQTPSATFQPSIGINTEAAQSEQNDIVFPMAFADIFRTARPFAEYSCKDVTYDAHGWPNALPATCTGKNPAVIRTFLLDNTLQGMIPSGQYTVLYEGTGTINYSGYAKLISHSAGRDQIEITLPAKLNTAAGAVNRMVLQIASGAVKNIRVIMPGGICEGSPAVRVENASGCAAGQYRSFEDTLRTNRNAIVFNPDYLNFLKDFRVVRMMNLMEASPSGMTCVQTAADNPNSFIRDSAGKYVYDQACLNEDFTWDKRSTMDDAVWGASANTARIKRYGRGVPLEVQVELANQLNAHPWFNIIHNATDTYAREFANYVSANLKPGLKAHVEYSNEIWNATNFWAAAYMREKGKGLYTAADNAYWDGQYYYAKRASKIFQIWEEVFDGTNRIVRILGTQQGSPDTTRTMLNYSDTKQYVDAIATGGYFYACWDRNNTKCTDTTLIPKPLAEATSVDDIFAAIDNANDPYGMEGLKNQFIRQAAVAKSFGKALYAYEGGQHLTIAGAIADDRRQSMIDLFHAANRDPRMGEHYQRLLESWKAAEGQTFLLFSVPHTFSRFGSFGVKESLNQPRTSAPKYDGAMKFQENQGKCWWSGC
jgi:hypothetical protein